MDSMFLWTRSIQYGKKVFTSVFGFQLVGLEEVLHGVEGMLLLSHSCSIRTLWKKKNQSLCQNIVLAHGLTSPNIFKIQWKSWSMKGPWSLSQINQLPLLFSYLFSSLDCLKYMFWCSILCYLDFLKLFLCLMSY